jgi:Fe-S-cluster-containing dehydrogenase component/formate-dependent nitrite reductase membrane component NrfD
MTRWSWVIDQTKCIGCHACTTACKSENDVAVGVFRTWVKNVDVGIFPDVKRHFAVLRCNHCEDAPCVAICPVTAMYQRPDGLVDFDESICIGCKACMQACPYDAIYMDPDSNTAAKCNFCSHRVDEGLLPACVVVCPVEALVFGDMDDPTSKVSRELAAKQVTVRRPEQRTRPKAYYIGAHEAALDPLGAEHETMYMWADRGTGAPEHGGTGPSTSMPRSPGAAVPRVSYDIPRQRTWGWKVSSYIWTKSLAAGGGLLAAAAYIFGAGGGTAFERLFAPLLAIVALALTGLLLVVDLKRPERFWTILVRPQWRSWLARGAFIITAYGALLTAWLWFAWQGNGRALNALAWPTAILAMLTAIYTAFLFAQCEGRDLWQDRRLLAHLALHPVIASVSAQLIAAPLVTGRLITEGGTDLALLMALAAFFVFGLGDAFGRHATANAAAAARQLSGGRQAWMFWTALIVGAAIPALLLIGAWPASGPAAGAMALIGLWMHSHALILAGQGPPIS